MYILPMVGLRLGVQSVHRKKSLCSRGIEKESTYLWCRKGYRVCNADRDLKQEAYAARAKDILSVYVCVCIVLMPSL